MDSRVRLLLNSFEDRIAPSSTPGLDWTFNSTGQAIIDFDQGGSMADLAAAVAVQPDGKIVVVGSAQVGQTDVDFAIVRLNADGTLDTSFGGGLRAIGFDRGGDNIDRATAVAIQPDGTIVVAGFAQVDAAGNFDFAVVRLTSVGELDLSFDADGRQTVAFDFAGGPKEDKAAGVAIDSQGRILVAGSVARANAGDFDFGVARLLSNGSPDISFDGDGLRTIAFNRGGNNADLVAGVAVDSKDRAVVAGSVQTGATGNFDFGLARLAVDGSSDATFNGTGQATVAFNVGGDKSDTAAGVVLDAASRVLVTGTVTANGAGNSDIGIARLNADGTIDGSFADGGKRTYGFDLDVTRGDRAVGLAVNPSTGSIVIAATVDTAAAGNTDIGILRLTSGGDLDRSLSPNGRARVAFDRGGTNADTAGGIALDSAGRIYVAASVDLAVAPNRDIGAARVVANTYLSQLLVAGGPLDGSGRSYRTDAIAFAFQADVVGPSATATTRTAVADLNGDGVPDQILGAGPGGGSRVRILIATDPAIIDPTIIPPIEFDAFEGGFNGGVFVTAADVDGDGRAEFAVSPDVGGGPRASVYSLDAKNSPLKRADFFGIDDLNFRGGARVAMGDINFDGRAELVVGAGFLGGPRVAIFAGSTLFSPGPDGTPPKLVGDFFAFPGQDALTLRNGVFVAVGDLDGDGRGDLIFGGGPGGGPRVFALNGKLILAQQYDAAYAQPLANFFVAGDTESRGGVRLAVKDLDGDARADLVTASGDRLASRIRIYRGITAAQPNGVEPPLAQEFDPFGDELFNGVFVG
jgi:uncharacterized delta-60 repeat protein